MFEASEVRQFPLPPEALARALPAAMYQTFGASLMPTGPGIFLGRGMKNSWGMTPTIAVRVIQGPQGTHVETVVGADVDTIYLVGAICISLAVFPLGLALPFLAFHDFDTKRKLAFFALWGQVNAALGPGATPAGTFAGAPTAAGPYGGGAPPPNPYIGR